MEALILIPLGILAFLIWVIASLISFRGRLQRLESGLDLIRHRLARVEQEGRAGTRAAGEGASPASAPAPGTREPRDRQPGVEPGAIEGMGAAWVSTAPPPEPGDLGVVPGAIPAGVRGAAGGTPGALPPRVVPPSPLPPVRPPIPVGTGVRATAVNWEQFMGVKMFSWIGGFALFLAVAFFVKYSFDNGWISPALRVAMGYVTGLGLLVGGVWLQRRPEYRVASHSLCGTGVVILYAVSFAAHAAYGLIGNGPTFALMVLVTATAFLLSVRMSAMPVAILGMLGGFLTPSLLSTGVDHPFGLFGYIALLDAGLLAVALRRRWTFLAALGALGTVLMEAGWAGRFYGPEKAGIALGVFVTFNLLFLAGALAEERWGRAFADVPSGGSGTTPREPVTGGTQWFTGAVLGQAFATFLFVLWLLAQHSLGERPGMIYGFLLAADLAVLVLVLRRPEIHAAHLAAGSAAFLCLALWTGNFLTPELLNWALAGYLGFALLHSAFPVVLERRWPEARRAWLGHLFPPLALVLVMIPLFRELPASWVIWPVILLIDVIAIVLAAVSGALLGILGVLVLTLAVAGLWLFKVPAEAAATTELLLVCGGFAFFFFLIGLAFGERWFARLEQAALGVVGRDGKEAGPGPDPLSALLGLRADPATLRAQLPACAAILPFLLLVMAVTRLPMAGPSPVFGLALLLTAMVLVVARRLAVDLLVPVGLACVLALEWVWFGTGLRLPSGAGATVAWNVVFAAVYVAFPFVFARGDGTRILPWATSALSGPLHFFLVYRVVKQAWPNEFMGLLPAAFAVPMLGALAFVARSMPVTGEARTRLLAWFGGSALFFVTLIFPVQFEKQWITVGWALEGLACLWLFRRVPHPGLRGLGVALLAVAFLRLAVNPAVFEYHPRSGTRILNWYLYAYGVVTACLLTGARLLAPPRNRVFRQDAPPILYGLGTVLAFLLLNIEIADWFSGGGHLTFEFNASFGQDMTYSLAWGLFAFVLLSLGFRNAARGARWAGMGLLVITLLKLFLHDLWRLGGLYRVGSLIGLAVVLIVVSFIYQRFLAAPARPAGANANADTDTQDKP